VRGLRKSYRETPVLDGLDAEFRGGRLHAVTGPSGSGKTTFLHLLAGLELPDAGAIEVDGVELTGLDRAARAAQRRRTTAYVGQQAGLVPHLSALENVELSLALRGLEETRLPALAALEAVGLAERARQRVSRLSQGERARTTIARAVAARPKLLLADEPTSRLDQANGLAPRPSRPRDRRRRPLRDPRPPRDRAGRRAASARRRPLKPSLTTVDSPGGTATAGTRHGNESASCSNSDIRRSFRASAAWWR